MTYEYFSSQKLITDVWTGHVNTSRCQNAM